ncbi:MAG: sensor signal transduction histidine kinase [Hydrocarboniphaga sp.]|uniref:sensor histidine kinase n=1 Tax=Hydrocarboniphaga sp. TaxID=2033016 RepID=UPI00261B6BB4|nr:ATP-binding protein [Hydrocarboniphaga sp.]MDB5970590.1 sensor signal transduction histidine kinase [Hydrocarboniphaga sp.]
MVPTQSLLKRQLKRFFGSDFSIPSEWQGFIATVDSAYEEFEVDRELMERALEVSSEELLEANSEIRAIFQAIPDLVFRLDDEGTILSVKAGAGVDLPQRELSGKRIQECWLKYSGERFHEVLRRVIEEKAMVSIEHAEGAKGLESFHEVRLVPLLRNQVVAIARNITERKNAEAKLEQMHKQLANTSRQAGMAEIATNVLHNVGNVLNSVNVSASLVADSVKKSKSVGVAKVAALLREHEADLGRFMTEDPKGRLVPAYLAQLAEHLHADQQATLAELDSLQQNIEHIKKIVAMQQSYARVSGVVETAKVAELVEDSLRMNESSSSRHGIQTIREYADDVPLIQIDKHRVLQVLVNLLRNAKHACDDSGRPDKRITVRVACADARVRISVTDNGIGIVAENIKRIFNHGFTTRRNGHGFGLHSGALAAKEMGGSLSVHSDGPQQGATFTLELPLQPAQELS